MRVYALYKASHMQRNQFFVPSQSFEGGPPVFKQCLYIVLLATSSKKKVLEHARCSAKI